MKCTRLGIIVPRANRSLNVVTICTDEWQRNTQSALLRELIKGGDSSESLPICCLYATKNFQQHKVTLSRVLSTWLADAPQEQPTDRRNAVTLCHLTAPTDRV